MQYIVFLHFIIAKAILSTPIKEPAKTNNHMQHSYFYHTAYNKNQSTSLPLISQLYHISKDY